jgi:Ca2+-dependent lipid-binding protein
MGTEGSKIKEAEFREDGVCVLEIVRADNLPNMDVGSLTDAYIKVSILNGSGPVSLRGLKRQTLTRDNSLNPVFHSYLSFPFIPLDADMLSVRAVDKDLVTTDDKIGNAVIDFGSLRAATDITTLQLAMSTNSKSKDDATPTVSVRLVYSGPKITEPLRKDIFVI